MEEQIINDSYTTTEMIILPVPSAADDHAIRDDKLAHIVLVSSQHLPRFNFNPYSPMSKRPLDAKF